MARKLGLADGTYRSYEAGATIPATALWAVLKAFSDVNPWWLVSGEGEPYIDNVEEPIEDLPIAELVGRIRRQAQARLGVNVDVCLVLRPDLAKEETDGADSLPGMRRARIDARG